MIINNKSLKGFYQYKYGVTYEPDDLIYYKGNIYKVTELYNGIDNKLIDDQVIQVEQTPDDSTKCTLYVTWLKENNLLNDIVTTKDLAGIYPIKGVSVGGIIEAIDNIDNIETTSIYYYNNEGVYNIVRTYKSDDENLVQELIDPTTPKIQFRRKINGSWSNWSSIISCKGGAVEFNSYLGEILDRSSKLNKDAAEFYSTCKSLTYISLQESDGSYKIPVEGMADAILKCVISYKLNEVDYQSEFTADLSGALNSSENCSINSVSSDNLGCSVSTHVTDGVCKVTIIGPSSVSEFKILKALLFYRND